MRPQTQRLSLEMKNFRLLSPELIVDVFFLVRKQGTSLLKYFTTSSVVPQTMSCVTNTG